MTAAKIARLKALHAEGVSYADIARDIGTTVHAPIKPATAPVRERIVHPATGLAPLASVPLTVGQPIQHFGGHQHAAHSAGPARLTGAEALRATPIPSPRACQWPMNNGRPWVFCGDCEVVAGRPYCVRHNDASIAAMQPRPIKVPA